MANGPRRSGGGDKSPQLKIVRSEWKFFGGMYTLLLSLMATKGIQSLSGQISGNVSNTPIQVRTATTGPTNLDPIQVPLTAPSVKVDLTFTGDDGEIIFFMGDLTVLQPTNAIGVEVVTREIPYNGEVHFVIGIRFFSATKFPLIGKPFELKLGSFFSRSLVTDVKGQAVVVFGPVVRGQMYMVSVTTPEMGTQEFPRRIRAEAPRQLQFDIIENPGKKTFTLTIVVRDAQKYVPVSNVKVSFRVGTVFDGSKETNPEGLVTSPRFTYAPGRRTRYDVLVEGVRHKHSFIERPAGIVKTVSTGSKHVIKVTGFCSAFREAKNRVR